MLRTLSSGFSPVRIGSSPAASDDEPEALLSEPEEDGSAVLVPPQAARDRSIPATSSRLISFFMVLLLCFEKFMLAIVSY